MVLLNSTRYLNRWLGPFLLRNGIRVRKRFVIEGTDHPYLDVALGVTLGKWLTALEARDHANDLIEAASRQQASSSLSSSSANTVSKDQSAFLSLEQESDLRVKVLCDYVRPALLPNESWGRDVANQWQFYPRLIRWLRYQYLDARFGPHVRAVRQAYPALAQSPQFARNTPPTFLNLPKSSLVEAALCYTTLHNDDDEVHQGNSDTFNSSISKNQQQQQQRQWASTKNRDAIVKSMQSIASRHGGKTHIVRGGALCWNELPAETSLEKVPLSHILQLVGANVLACAPLNTWLEQRGQFQFLTQEYIAKLATYLVQRSQGQATTILEVGAGDGLLTVVLQDYVENHYRLSQSKNRPGKRRSTPSKTRSNSPSSSSTGNPPPLLTFVATDDESWSIRKKATVWKMDYKQALEKYARTTTNHDGQDGSDDSRVIVLCSWMPMNDDWTATFRSFGDVVEYVLVGEADDGQCGDHWMTWGNKNFVEDSSKDATPPYHVDGFRRVDLTELHPYQFSAYDSALSKEGMTVSFRRQRH